MIQLLRRAARITTVRPTETTHRGFKIPAGILVVESSPPGHKYSRTRARGHWCWGLSNQLLPSWADLPLGSAGDVTITPSPRAVGAPQDQGPIRNPLEKPLEGFSKEKLQGTTSPGGSKLKGQNDSGIRGADSNGQESPGRDRSEMSPAGEAAPLYLL